MSARGPATTWAQPGFAAGVPGVIFVMPGITAAFALSPNDFNPADADAVGVAVPTSAGSKVAHHPLASPGTALGRGSVGFSFEIQLVGEDDHRYFGQLRGAAAIGKSSVWFQWPHVETWFGDGARTTHVMPRSAAWATTAGVVSFADSPPRSWIGSSELVYTAGSPGAGEFQIDAASDAGMFVTGDVPAAGALITLRYYPLFRVSELELEQAQGGYNDATAGVSFVEMVAPKNYG